MMQGLSPRGEVRRKHGTNVRVDGQKPNRRRPYRTSGQRTAKSIIHQGAKRRFGDCARKVTELTQEICSVSLRRLRWANVSRLCREACLAVVGRRMRPANRDPGREARGQ